MSISLTGFNAQGAYAAAANTNALFDAILALIPDVTIAIPGDPTSVRLNTSGPIAGVPGWLDEMSPITAAQLRAELLAARTEAGNVAI